MGTGATARRGGTKQDRALRTHEQILGAGAHEFATRGFHDVTIADIADRAGVTAGAVYFHYLNKEDIARSVSERYYARLLTLFNGVKELDLPPMEAIAEIVTRLAAALLEDKIFQAAVRLQVDLSHSQNPLPTPFVAFMDAIAEFLVEAKELGQLDAACGEPAALARVIAAAVYGAQHISWVLHDRADVVERFREVTDALIPRRPL